MKLISDCVNPDWERWLFAVFPRSRVLDTSHVPDDIVIVRKSEAEHFHHLCKYDLYADNQSEHFTKGQR